MKVSDDDRRRSGASNWRRQPKHRPSIVVYLIAAFAVCLVAIGALMVMTTATSFRREMAKVSSELRAAAQSDADASDQTVPQVAQVLDGLASQPDILAFDPARCQAVLSGLTSIGNQGHIHLLRPDGSPVCSLLAPDLTEKQVVAGAWFDQARADPEGGLVNGGTGIDPVSGRPSITVALPVPGPDGTGVLVAVLYTSAVPIELPAGASPKMVLFELDANRRIVLATSLGAPVRPGPINGPWMSKPLPRGSGTVLDPDGVRRIYREVAAPAAGWHVLAGIPVGVAFRDATNELRRNVTVGLSVFLVVAALGVILHRRLARPVRRLRHAIEAAASDASARAPVEGPAEVAAVAEAFNNTIAERRALEVQLSHLALHDPLTGLPNRVLLTDRLKQALARQRRSGGVTIVAFMDVDRFKLINDAHGHPSGDQLLVALARRLEGAARATDSVCRFGGDEFVVVMEGLTSVPHAALRAQGLVDCLAAPFSVEGQDIHVSASVGVAVSHGTETADDLIRNADIAMYRAKQAGSGYAFFDEPLRAGLLSRIETERELRDAVDHHEFVLHYQPKYSIATGEIVGVEALVRWQHPVRGLVAPGDFIPVSEETGLILPIGEWVLSEACGQASTWQKRQGLALTVAINVSARQMALPDMAARVAEIVAESGADPRQVCLEITEGILLADTPAVVQQLVDIRATGVRISIDDFGTGYSSLAYLRRLPIDELKIDRSFIAPLTTDPSASAVVASVVTLGHALGLVVVAEGVETADQLAILRELDCDQAQGFYLARPQPVTQLMPALLGRRRPAFAQAAVS